MGLELRKSSKYWYGRFSINGQRYCVNLDVEVRGQRPTEPGQAGNPAFENSRGAAREALRRHIADARSNKSAIKHQEQLYELKAGEKIGTAPLSDIFPLWQKAAGKKDRSPKYVEIIRQLIKRFTDHVEAKHPKAQTVSQITPAIAKEFMAAVSKDKETKKEITGRTYTSILVMLRSIFKRIGPEAGLPVNPFQGIPGRPLHTEHRKPFTIEQLTKVLAAAPPLVRHLIVTGLCTAMRRGDCCMLRWEDVDLEAKFIRVKTNKTGETAEIPIFDLLQKELEPLPRTSPYVFPEAAEIYLRNPNGITKATKHAFKAAVDETTQKREDGCLSASVHDFHSLRTTWITLALTAGIPMELVRRVTGHQTVDVVLKHYFRPGREDFQKTLNAKMPALLTGGSSSKSRSSPIDDALQILRGITPSNWRKSVKEATAVLEKASAGAST